MQKKDVFKVEGVPLHCSIEVGNKMKRVLSHEAHIAAVSEKALHFYFEFTA